MSEQVAAAAAREAVLTRFAWRAGHGDVWSVFSDGAAFAAVVDGMAEPWLGCGISHVVAVESRGFLLGGAVAVRLGAGLVGVRKPGGLLPGSTVQVTARRDYRGREHELRMQAVLAPGDVVLLVDDWAERGSQAQAASGLVEQCGARVAGLALMIDQLDDGARAKHARVTALVTAAELGDPNAL